MLRRGIGPLMRPICAKNQTLFPLTLSDYTRELFTTRYIFRWRLIIFEGRKLTSKINTKNVLDLTERRSEATAASRLNITLVCSMFGDAQALSVSLPVRQAKKVRLAQQTQKRR